MNKSNYRQSGSIYFGLITIGGGFIVVLFFLLQGYAFIIRNEGKLPLSPLFGNFPQNRAVLEQQPPKNEFTFAVVGDTSSIGTFERISEQLRRMPLDFAVLLGDCVYTHTVHQHRYFRAEYDEFALPFPVFYVVGNRDVSSDGFPLDLFEKEYGPSIFSFEYQRCLFIVLRILEDPASIEDSIAFLNRLKDIKKYQHRFVFMHRPTPVSPDMPFGGFHRAQEFPILFEKLGIDYIFAAHFHGYGRAKVRNINYIITGGGGEELDHYGKQFHHAMVIRVGKNYLSEKIVHSPPEKHIEDRLERFAIVNVWPWMQQNPIFLAILDCLLLLLFLVLMLRGLQAKKRLFVN